MAIIQIHKSNGFKILFLNHPIVGE